MGQVRPTGPTPLVTFSLLFLSRKKKKTEYPFRIIIKTELSASQTRPKKRRFHCVLFGSFPQNKLFKSLRLPCVWGLPSYVIKNLIAYKYSSKPLHLGFKPQPTSSPSLSLFLILFPTELKYQIVTAKFMEQSKRTDSLKFLCSYGGKILPRYTDGKLRYVGGLTRVLSVDPSISFAGSLAALFDWLLFFFSFFSKNIYVKFWMFVYGLQS